MPLPGTCRRITSEISRATQDIRINHPGKLAVREGKISKGRLLQYGWHLATMDSLRLWTETFKQYTFGLFKVVNAPLAGIIDISDVFWNVHFIICVVKWFTNQ